MEKLYFLLLKSVKHQKAPLGQSASSNFVANKVYDGMYFGHNLINSSEWRELIFIPVVLLEQWSQPLIMPPAS